MAAYEGPAVLRWRVNGSTLVDCNVHASVDSTRSGWDVRVVSSTEDDQWGLEMFPRPLQSIFLDGSSSDVDAESTGGDRCQVTAGTLRPSTRTYIEGQTPTPMIPSSGADRATCVRDVLEAQHQ